MSATPTGTTMQPAPATSTGSSTMTTSTTTANSSDSSSTSGIFISRTAMEFFTTAAPKLHAAVRELQAENKLLREENSKLREEVEILDGISHFLREMSKTDLNYAQFMAKKTAEVEAEKARKREELTTLKMAPSLIPQKKLPPLAPLVPIQPQTKSTTISSKPAAPIPSKNDFSSMVDSLFNSDATTSTSAALPTPISVDSNDSSSASSNSLRPPSSYQRTKPKFTQKRAPTDPAGEGAIYSYTHASSENPAMRHVTPYTHEYHVFVKQRMFGKTLLEVLIADYKAPTSTAEDPDEPSDGASPSSSNASSTCASTDRIHAESYYRQLISTGMIKINDAVVDPGYILRNGDHWIHYSHKHEPPVLDIRMDSKTPEHAITIVADTPDLLVVNKPPSIPVHESGRYRHQSLLGILWNQSPYQKQQLFPVHRLDKVTSGVVILAKNKEAAAKMSSLMKFTEEEEDEDKSQNEEKNSPTASSPSSSLPVKNVTKTYVARVRGDFLAAGSAGLQIRGLSSFAHTVTLSHLDCVTLSAPILTVSLRKGIHAVDFDQGKSAVTMFTKLFYDAKSNTSVLKVQPLTGRTHQIRLHLQYLQHGIINDPLYGEGAWEGNTYQSHSQHPDPNVQNHVSPAYEPSCADCVNQLYYRPSADHGLRYCTGIYLHALSYTIASDQSFETELPSWAKPDFDVLTALGKRVQTTARAIDVLKQQESQSH